MACIFLAGWPEQHARLPKDCSGDGAAAKRRHRRFPAPGHVKPEESAPYVRSLSLLVKVSSGTEYGGELTHWDEHESLFWQFLRGPWDAYSVKIDVALRVLNPPQVVQTHRAITRLTLRRSEVPVNIGTLQCEVLSRAAGRGRILSGQELHAFLGVSDVA